MQKTISPKELLANISKNRNWHKNLIDRKLAYKYKNAAINGKITIVS